MNLEDELVAAMRAHDDEAPTASRLMIPDGNKTSLQTRAERERHWAWGALAWAACLIVAAGLITVLAHRGHSTGPTAPATSADVAALTCPPTKGKTADGSLWVPTKARGLDAATRLAPTATPARAVVCAYLGRDGSNRITGSKVLTGDLSVIAAMLSPQPEHGLHDAYACPAKGPSTDDYYLFGLSYHGATEWVAMPDRSCPPDAANGTFSAAADLGEFAAQAYVSGRVGPSAPGSDTCAQLAVGIVSTNPAMVPGNPVSLGICVPSATGDGTAVRVSLDHGFGDLVDALNQLPTQPCDDSCTGEPAAAGTYNLEFAYAAGMAPVRVQVRSADPSIVSNGRVAATSSVTVSATVLPIIDRLLGRR